MGTEKNMKYRKQDGLKKRRQRKRKEEIERRVDKNSNE
jgi:hypothetical protein